MTQSVRKAFPKICAVGLSAAMLLLSPGLACFEALAQVVGPSAPAAPELPGAPISGAPSDLGLALPVEPQLPAGGFGSPDLSSLAGLGAASESDLKRVPVRIQVPAGELEKLDPQQRELAGKAVALLEKDGGLFAWESFPVRLPGTVFDGQSTRIIDLKDLFKAPTSDEVRRIGTSDGGRGPKLTPEQLAEIKSQGRFTVPSVQYPGQSHVWQLSVWLQKGESAIVLTRQGYQARALDQLIIRMPQRLSGSQSPNLESAARNTSRGLRELISLAVGLKSERPTYAGYDIEERVETEKLADLGRSGPTVGFDARLYDEKLWEKATPLLQQAKRKADESWAKMKEEAEAVVDGRSDMFGGGMASTPQERVDELVRLENSNLELTILNDPAIEKLSPGLGKLVVARLQAQVIIRQATAESEAGYRAFEENVREEILKEHPVEGKIPDWLDAKVAAAVQNYRASFRMLLNRHIAESLKKQGLDHEALIFAKELNFYGLAAPDLREQLSAERTPNRTFTFGRRYWLKSSWRITKNEIEPGKVYFNIDKYSKVSVNSAELLWRVQNGVLRTLSWWNNGLYHLLVSNLWNGPLGVKSLLYPEPFAYEWVVDPATEKLVLSKSSLRGTLASRVRASWESRRAILDKFEKDQDYGFLGKDIARIGLFFSADLLRGVLVPLFLVVGQPLLTVVNLAASAALTGTSMLWAPAAVLALAAFNIAIFDTDRGASTKPFALPRGIFPAVDRAVGNVGVGGVLQAASSVLGLAGHLVAALALYGIGFFRTIVRRIWDAFMRGIISWRGRVPAKDYRFLRRVAGPGLSADQFFQVPSDLVLVALQAGLESEALEQYRADAKGLILMPRAAFEAAMESLGVVTASRGYADASPAFQSIGTEEKANLERLDAAVAERAKLYARLLSLPQARIKLASSDYETTLKKAVVLTRNFHEAFFKAQGWDDAKTAQFWKSRGLASDDWEGLAKSLLGRLFGSEILTPLEETDKSLRIEVTAPSLREYAAGLEKGILPEALANVTLTGTSSAPAASVSPQVPDAGSLLLDRDLVRESGTPRASRPSRSSIPRRLVRSSQRGMTRLGVILIVSGVAAAIALIVGLMVHSGAKQGALWQSSPARPAAAAVEQARAARDIPALKKLGQEARDRQAKRVYPGDKAEAFDAFDGMVAMRAEEGANALSDDPSQRLGGRRPEAWTRELAGEEASARSQRSVTGLAQGLDALDKELAVEEQASKAWHADLQKFSHEVPTVGGGDLGRQEGLANEAMKEFDGEKDAEQGLRGDYQGKMRADVADILTQTSEEYRVRSAHVDALGRLADGRLKSLPATGESIQKDLRDIASHRQKQKEYLDQAPQHKADPVLKDGKPVLGQDGQPVTVDNSQHYQDLADTEGSAARSAIDALQRDLDAFNRDLHDVRTDSAMKAEGLVDALPYSAAHQYRNDWFSDDILDPDNLNDYQKPRVTAAEANDALNRFPRVLGAIDAVRSTIGTRRAEEQKKVDQMVDDELKAETGRSW